MTSTKTQPPPMMEVSDLADKALNLKSPLLEGLTRALSNPYDPITNPSGIVNLGTAENYLMYDTLAAKLNDPAIRHVDQSMLMYGPMHGSDKLRGALAGLFNRYWKPVQEVTAEEITVHAGCGATICNVVQTVTNPGEGILIPAPYYGGFDFDLTLYAQAKPIPVNTRAEDYFAVTEKELEKTYQESMAAGIIVRAVLLTNPQNPVGRALSRAQILPLLQWAKTRHLHVIVDEIYALSTYTHPTLFESVLSFPDLPDPAHTHVLWSMSKDFGSSGIRLGCCISRNAKVLSALRMFALFTICSSLVDGAVANLLGDEAWVDSYISENQRRMREQYIWATEELDRMKIPYMPADSGFFIMVNLQKWLPSPILDNDPLKTPWRRLWNALIDRGVYAAPGEAFNCPETGYVRIVFTVSRDLLTLGLERLGTGLKDIEHS
ncbi:pyridoxal phosphate-dependent transferase [Phlyctochytrium arcticum]|nr:pyridoxal phosphate-dependent transferase [Phlyctochytrium arcticum]